MALLTYNWQPPDFSSLLASALHGEELQRVAAAQQLEQQRLVQKQAADIAAQLRQEQRLADAENFRQQLEGAREARQARDTDSKIADRLAKSAPPPILPEGGSSPSGDSGGTDMPLPTADGAAKTTALVPSFPSYHSLLFASDDNTLEDKVSLDNPAPFSLGMGDASPVAEPWSAGVTHRRALDPTVTPLGMTNRAPTPLRIGDEMVSDLSDVPQTFDPPSDDPSRNFSETIGTMMRGDSPADWNVSAPRAEDDGPPDTAETWARLREQGGLPAGGPSVAGEPDLFGGQQVGPADRIRAAMNGLSPEARQRLNVVAKMPGVTRAAWDRQLAAELADARRTATGRQRQVRLVMATDGNRYRVDDQGRPMDPLPEGVHLGQAPSRSATSNRPITKTFPDGSLRRYNPATDDFDVLAEKPAKPEKPVVANMADGTTRQWNPETRQWDTLATKQSESMSDAVDGMTFVPDHNTYKNEDGAEFFVSRQNGHITMRAYRPDAHPATKLWGSDGQVYFFDNHGNPLREVPEGVQLREHSRFQTDNVPGKGLVLVNPDKTTTVLVPEGLKITNQQKNQLVDDYAAVHDANEELEKQKAMLRDNPSRASSWFGGGTDRSVKEAQRKLDEATKRASHWMDVFPDLKATVPGAQPSTTEPTLPSDTPAAASPSVPTITTKEQRDKLPAGTIYVGPDGKRYVKK